MQKENHIVFYLIISEKIVKERFRVGVQKVNGKWRGKFDGLPIW